MNRSQAKIKTLQIADLQGVGGSLTADPITADALTATTWQAIGLAGTTLAAVEAAA